LNSILRTYQRLQQYLFDSENEVSTNVADYLKSVIESRFKVNDVPDTFLFFPEELGGLGLRNPFIPMFIIRK